MNISKSMIRQSPSSALGIAALLLRGRGAADEDRLRRRNRRRRAEVARQRRRRLADRERERQQKVLGVDGRQWKEGQSSAGIADKARALYGERYAEFLDRVQAYAYYPYVVAKDVADFRDGEITVRFEGISGRIDQGAGILFNLKPNGDYLTIRANCSKTISCCGSSRRASARR